MISLFRQKKTSLNDQVTISLSYYNDGDFLKCQIKSFSEYLGEINIQIIDDGSKSDPIENYLDDIPECISVYKILDDIPWNIPGVRNLGSMIAPTPWILHLDMDHIIPKKSIDQISKLDLNKKGKFYSFNRQLKDITKFTAGTLLISVEDFWNCGGYDEEFAGAYGHNDPFLKKKLNIHGVKEIKLSNVWFEDYGSEASCSLPRNEIMRNQSLMNEKLRNKEYFSKNICFRWKKLNQKYEQ